MTITTVTPPPARQNAYSVDPDMGGVNAKYRFPNGFGASVIRHKYSYGGKSGLWELAVISEANDWGLTYETCITSDVIGWLNDDELQQALDAVEALESVR